MIHIGRDGWLFLTEGTNGVLAQFRRSPETNAVIAGWVAVLARRVAACRAIGATFVHVVVPEKITIHDDRLAGLALDVSLAPANRLRRALRLRPALRHANLDLVAPLRAARDGPPLYFRTDSHYTFAGRLVAYEALCARLGAVPRRDLQARPSRRIVWTGDLGLQLDPPHAETIDVVDLRRDARRTYASPIVAKREAEGNLSALHVGAHVIYTNPAPEADPRTVVLFGDSCAHFEPTMLTIMLAETFRSVHFVWSTSVDWSYVRGARPDVVITQIAERFMRRVPEDLFDLRHYALERYGRELHRAGYPLEGPEGPETDALDPGYYLATNPDVASLAVKYPDKAAFAAFHYRHFGQAEGRHPNLGACLRDIRREDGAPIPERTTARSARAEANDVA